MSNHQPSEIPGSHIPDADDCDQSDSSHSNSGHSVDSLMSGSIPSVVKDGIGQIIRGSRPNGQQGNMSVPRPKKGMLKKISSSMIKNWRTRYFTLEEGIMTYFEPVKWFVKGQYDLYGLEFYSVEGDKPTCIRMRCPNRPDIVLKCKDEKSQRRWLHAIKEHLEFANAKGKATSIVERFSVAEPRYAPSQLVDEPQARFTTIQPEPCTGWLKKKGQLFPSIKKRFFVLENGVISYYKKDVLVQLQNLQNEKDQSGEDTSCFQSSPSSSKNKKRRIPKPLGKFAVLDYDIRPDIVSGNLELFLSPGLRSKSKRRLIIYPEDFQERDRWQKALQEHALFQSFQT